MRIPGIPEGRRPALLTLVGLALSLQGCVPTGHPTRMVTLGAPPAPDWERTLDEPGPVRVESLVAADWEVARGGLINLEHPAAVGAGLEDGPEPIQLLVHVLRHPRRGLFLVDTGMSAAVAQGGAASPLGALVRLGMNADALAVRTTLGSWLAQQGAPVRGVILTHLHLDHLLGLPEVPAGTALYVGPGETQTRSTLNALLQPSIDRLLADHRPLQVLSMHPDRRFEGVLDLFGDGTVFVVHVPGHTRGSVAVVARTPEGPVLLLGDACHTRWGWEHGVEPGTFSDDIPRSADSLSRLRALVEAHPRLRAVPGHQP